MSVQVDANPWESPRSRDVQSIRPESESEREASHVWRGHRISVRAEAVSKFAFLMNRFRVSVDGFEFQSSQLRMSEDFRFYFDHHGRVVEGRFKAVGTGFANQSYRLFIEDELFDDSKVRISGWWKSCLMVSLVSGGCMVSLWFGI